MIKNMMCLKSLFVFLMLFCSLVLSVLFIGTTSYAYNHYGVDYEYYYNNVVPDDTFRLDIYSNIKIGMSKERTPGYNLYPITIYYNNQLVNIYQYYYRFYTEDPASGGVEISDIIYEVITGSNRNGFYYYFESGGIPIFDTDAELINYLTGSDIDFENPFYSSNIVAPNILHKIIFIIIYKTKYLNIIFIFQIRI